jgi:hypothetical protein
VQIYFTRFDDVTGERAKCVPLEWTELVRGLREQPPQKASKAELPLLMLARIGDRRTERNSLRHVDNIEAVSGCEGDYDGSKVDPTAPRMSMTEAVARLEAAGIEALLYETPSSTDALPRWRVLCPFSEPLALAERSRLLARVNGVLGGVLEPESFAPAQSFYFGHAQGRPYHCAHVAGAAVDTLHELDAGALYRPANTEARQHLTEAELQQQILTGADYYSSARDCAWRMIGRGLKPDDALTVLRALFMQRAASIADDDDKEKARIKKRWKDLERLVQGAWERNRPIELTYNGTPAATPAAPVNGHAWTGGPAPELRDPVLSLRVVNLETVTPQPLTWLWRHRIPRGKVGLIAGHPGVSKSALTCNIAALLTAGREWPDGAPITENGKVLMLNAEDSIADTIQPRLMAAGADLSRVRVIAGVQSDAPEQRDRILTLQDVALVDDYLAAHPGEFLLLVADPIGSLLGGADSHNDAEVRGALSPWKDLAEKHGITVLLVAHLNKDRTSDPEHRVLGSVGFMGVVRFAHLVAVAPEDNTLLLFLPFKSNIAPRGTMGLQYRVHTATPAPGIETAAIEWGGPEVRDYREIMSMRTQVGEERDTARDWLAEQLSRGPVRVSLLRQLASEQLECSWDTVRRAGQVLGVMGIGENRERTWQLPDLNGSDDEPAPMQNSSGEEAAVLHTAAKQQPVPVSTVAVLQNSNVHVAAFMPDETSRANTSEQNSSDDAPAVMHNSSDPGPASKQSSSGEGAAILQNSNGGYRADLHLCRQMQNSSGEEAAILQNSNGDGVASIPGADPWDDLPGLPEGAQ